MRCTSAGGGHTLEEGQRRDELYGSIAKCKDCGHEWLVDTDENKYRFRGGANDKE